MQRKVPSAIANITLNRATFTDVLIDGLTFVNFFYGTGIVRMEQALFGVVTTILVLYSLLVLSWILWKKISSVPAVHFVFRPL